MVKSIVLLSGGLDSLVCLGLKREELNIELALTFDYGQKSVYKEIQASRRICEYYDVEHKIVALDWLREITNTALVSDKIIPAGDDLKMSEDSAKSVWVPNRNGLFLNIAASYADSMNYKYILIGANSEEAQTFPDNTKEFLNGINEEFRYSTQVKPQVLAPLINYDKNDIVMLAIKHNVPLELVMSCYQSGEGHCGECESCVRLKHALKANGANEFIKLIFG